MTTIGNAMQDAINEQINKEFYSSYLYLSMAAYFEDKNLTGFGHWMRLQADEEREHAMKFYNFILDHKIQYLFRVISNNSQDLILNRKIANN